MRKTCFILVILFGIIGFTQAQERWQEVVYLRNGSVIRGIIIEQVPNRSIKIETADGSIFVYPMREVTKITKEPYRKNRLRRYAYREVPRRNCRYSCLDAYRYWGYRGFVEMGYAIGTGDNAEDRLEISTSHGYQFNPYLFLGGGVGFHYYTNADEAMLPFFVDFRANFIRGSVTPYAGVKLGYSALLGDIFGSSGGLYFSPSIGVRFSIDSDKAINVSLGYSLQRLNNDAYYDDYYYDGFTMNALHLKVGFEF